MKMLIALLPLVLAAGFAHGGPSPAPSLPVATVDTTQTADTPVLGSAPAGPLLWERGTEVAQSLPDCSGIDGHYCPTLNARARCYVYGYKEPMVCVCDPGNVWRCN